MRGERVRTAAATVGALGAEPARDDLAVVAFWSDAAVVLLSDCVHNAGPDPRPLAARVARLDVLLDASGEQDPISPATWPGWAAAGCVVSGLTMTSRPP